MNEWNLTPLPEVMPEGTEVIACASFLIGNCEHLYETVILCYDSDMGGWFISEFPEKEMEKVSVHCWIQVPELPVVIEEKITELLDA